MKTQKLLQSLLISVFLLLAWSPSAMAALNDGRLENPIQLQFVPFGGGAVGYHFTSWLYMGVWQLNPSTIESTMGSMFCTRCASSEAGTSQTIYEGEAGSTISSSRVQAVEIRFTPWSLGFYASIGFFSHEGVEETVQYDQRNRVFGTTNYNTAYSMKITTAAYQSAAFGLGFNHVFQSGWSAGIGFLGGIVKADRTYDASGFTAAALVTAAAESALEEAYGTEAMRTEATGLLTVGYNF